MRKRDARSKDKRKKPRKPRISAERKLRMRVFELLADSEIDGLVAIKNMQMQLEWLKTGIIPASLPNRPTLRLATNS